MELLEAKDCRADRKAGLHPAEARSGPSGPGPGGLMQESPRGEQAFPPRHIWNPCNPPSYGRNFAIAALIFALSGASSSALAAPPGAIVTNQATLDYVNLAGAVTSVPSNPVDVTVAVVRSPSSIEFTRVEQEVIESVEGTRIRLGDLVTMEKVPLSDAVVRENQRYAMLVNWEYVGTDRMRRDYIRNILDTMDLPYGYSAEESRQEFLTDQEEEDLQLTLILAAIFILMVMTALFESVSLPLLVLTSLPMALVGVVVTFPARIAYRWVAPPALQIAGIDGSVCQRFADRLDVRRAPQRRVHLGRRVVAQAGLVGEDQMMRGDLARDRLHEH